MSEVGPAAHLIDVTRLVSRAGRVLTGVDRVERAYVRQIAALGGFGLCRTGLGYLLVDSVGLGALLNGLDTSEWGRVDRVSRWMTKLDPTQKAAQSCIRRHAVARGRKRQLARMLRPYGGFTYLNVGHSNLTQATLGGVTEARLRVQVMIHDTIPLDYPEFQRPGTAARFESMLHRVVTHADRLVCVSIDAERRLRRHLVQMRKTIDIVTAPVGIDLAEAEPLPADLSLTQPYAVALGTIEPRKNHALLLDIWQDGAPLPLVIAGTRGWKNEDVFARLDAGLAGVIERGNLSDGQVRTLLERAAVLVFPSFAEGFGIPLAEAAALKTPVLCSDIAICHEVLGDYAVYLDPTDAYQWATELEAIAANPRSDLRPGYSPPTWDAHFKTVLTTV